MVDFDISVYTEHKRVVAFRLIGVKDTVSSHRFDSGTQENVNRSIFEHFDFVGEAISFLNTADRYPIGNSFAYWALSPASEVPLIHLDFTAEKSRSIRRVSHSSHNQLKGF